MSDRANEWILSAVKAMDQLADEEICVRVLEQCGRSCLPEEIREVAAKAREECVTPKQAFERLAAKLDVTRIEDDAVYVEYPRCYCEHLKGVSPEDVPDLFCACSIGWLKELFGTATGPECVVDVVLERSVVRGDDQCRFRVTISQAGRARSRIQPA